MRLNAFELTYYPPSVTVRYTSKQTADLISQTIAIPREIASIDACIEYLTQSHRFFAHYKAQTNYIASTLLGVQKINTKFKYVARAVMAPEVLPITSCHLDKAGETCIVTSHDRTAKLYDLSTVRTSKVAPSEKHVLEGHEGVVYAASFSYPEATICATASFDGSCRLWCVDTGALLGTLMVSNDICEFLSIQFSPVAPTLLATGNASGSVYVWDVNRPEGPVVLLPHTHSEEVIALRFNEQSDSKLITASFDGRVQLHDLRLSSTMSTLNCADNEAHSTASTRIITKHHAEITAIDTDPSGTMLVSASSDGLFRITDLRATETPVYEHNFGSEIISCSMALSKRYTALSVAYGEAGTGEGIILPRVLEQKKEGKKVKGEVNVYILDNDQQGLAGVLRGHVGEVSMVRFVPPGFGNRIITCSNDRTLRVWSTPDDPKKPCAEVARLDGHMDGVATFDVSYDASVIVSASIDNVFRVWSVK